MAKTKTKVLKELDINEVALVDVGANHRARVVIHKRAAQKMACECGEEDEAEGVEPVEMKCKKCGKPMKMAKAMPNAGALHVDKPLGEEAEEDEDLDLAGHKKATKKAAQPAEGGSMTEEVTKLQAELDAVKAENVDLRKQVDAHENAPEQVEKRALAALPESIRKRLEDAEESLKKMADEKATREAVEKAKGLPGVDASEFGPVLKRMGAEDAEIVLKTIRALAEQSRVGKLFDVAGSDATVGAGDSPDEIAKRADALAKAEKIDVGEAMERIFRQDPAAYNAYRRSVSVSR